MLTIKSMNPLTKEQAAVISAYTGFLIGEFSDMHKYAQEKLGRSIFTHEFANKELGDELREAAKSDFLSLDPPKASPCTSTSA